MVHPTTGTTRATRRHSGQTWKCAHNFGERYTAPNENDRDVRTTLLAGIGISPSEKLNLRLLLVPNFREGIDGQELDQLQLWLGLTVTP